ncbi:hypothetical protein DPMN_166300 [Dreissena polymorpha]|uniref:Uncharacterized protein n=1 Tax=Dreissena polymorpha TaxID=45954 RepID=A0A9D4EYD9_DREPO|nr:hypothetical protein DPMN_166300 [Dreissena polymorpha]
MTLDMADGDHLDEDGRRTRQISGPSCQHVLCYQLFAVFMFSIGLVGGIFIGMYVDPKIYNKDNKNCPSGTNQVINNANTEHVPTVENKSSIEAKSGECALTSPVTQKRYEDTVFAPLTTAEIPSSSLSEKFRNHFNARRTERLDT